MEGVKVECIKDLLIDYKFDVCSANFKGILRGQLKLCTQIGEDLLHGKIYKIMGKNGDIIWLTQGEFDNHFIVSEVCAESGKFNMDPDID